MALTLKPTDARGGQGSRILKTASDATTFLVSSTILNQMVQFFLAFYAGN
jgi:hypothetical protein